jgi:hypothetical protein
MEVLRIAVEKSGMTKKEISEFLEITEDLFQRKLSGVERFNAKEKRILSQLLNVPMRCFW